MTDTGTLFTGRDILAAENHLRQGTQAQAMRVAVQIPAEVIERLAVHVKADPSDLTAVITRARLPYAAR